MHFTGADTQFMKVDSPERQKQPTLFKLLS